MLKKGLYEELVNKRLDQQLNELGNDIKYDLEELDAAEASKVLTMYLSDIVKQELDFISDKKDSLSIQVSLINKMVDVLKVYTGREDYYDGLEIVEKAQQLLDLYDKKECSSLVDNHHVIKRPETSISQSSLFTGAVHEPQMYSELKKEIVSSDRIDMLVSFIKWSGLRLIIDELSTFTYGGGCLRVITTSYMGATDFKAIEELAKLPNTTIKVSYDTKRTRLHAKTYVFYRETGFTTAYVGSSNMSNAALSSGLEWNVKLTKKDMKDTIDKVEATFNSYWNSTEFEYYSNEFKSKLYEALKSEKYHDTSDEYRYVMDINPYPFQQEILDCLKAEREIKGNYRNLICAATGCGKTVISAFDYRRFIQDNNKKKCRLLFIAHREEILKQSLATFRAILKDENFGDMFVGKYKPDNIECLFMSIQTFNSQNFTSQTTEDFYDYIIIDEFHHAAAPTYQTLLNYYQPQILLGLTATPERMDGKNILDYFDNRIAAEIRLPEAIDRKLLCPFQYFGVTDSVDLSSIKWNKGGYDLRELSYIYSQDDTSAIHRADLILRSVLKCVTDIDEVKGLGFCVSVEHAEFMSRYFNEKGISSMCLTGKSISEERDNAQKRLVDGDIKFIFVVDIYNEGVDIPEINTVLFLRPTESLTIFLQQLGRGLRLSEGKDCLTVLDFIGQANRRYNFEQKFLSLLSTTTKSIKSEIESGFISVPKGCYIQLEEKAQKYILDNIRASYNTKRGILQYITHFESDTGQKLTLTHFLNYYHLSPHVIYRYGLFSSLCVEAGVIDRAKEEYDKDLYKGFYKLCHIDSRRWINFLLEYLKNDEVIDYGKLSKTSQLMLQMFVVTIYDNVITDWENDPLLDKLKVLKNNSHIVLELEELLMYKYNTIDFIDESVDVKFECPLDVYCTYTRNQLLVALEFMKPNTVREGVKWLPQKKVDVLMVTLNKSDKDYSPSTMYEDYSINETLFHWQSQNKVSENSETGKRYINHIKRGSNVFLFVREYKKDMYKETEAYTFLGKVKYKSHTGSYPMNIIWELEKSIPAKFLKKTNKLLN